METCETKLLLDCIKCYIQNYQKKLHAATYDQRKENQKMNELINGITLISLGVYSVQSQSISHHYKLTPD